MLVDRSLREHWESTGESDARTAAAALPGEPRLRPAERGMEGA